MTAGTITLTNSMGVAKDFMLLSLVRSSRRRETINFAVGGRPYASKGKRYFVFVVTLLFPETPSGNDGGLGTLENLHALANPLLTSSASSRLTLTDPQGAEYSVEMTGNLNPEPVGVLLYGARAYYKVNVEFLDLTRTRLDLDLSESKHSATMALL